MVGGEKPGDAKADRVREKFARNDEELDRAIMPLEFRARMQSAGETEDSGIIEQQVLEAQRALDIQRRKESEAPGSGYSKHAVWLIRSVKGWPQAVFGIALLVLLGFIAWLKWK